MTVAEQLESLSRPSGVQSFNSGFTEVEAAIYQLMQAHHAIGYAVIVDGSGRKMEVNVTHYLTCRRCQHWD